MSGHRLFGPGASGLEPGVPPSAGHLPRTALPVHGGIPRHLEAHLHRLEAGAAALDQPVDWLPSLHADLAGWLSAGSPMDAAALRLVLHPRAGVLSARLEPLPTSAQPYRLALLPHPLAARRLDPTVCHKGLAGPWGTMLLAEARRRGAQDALLQWPDGSLAETAIAAVGIEAGGVLRVPPPQGRVASLAERLELPAWALSRGLRVEAAELTLALALEGRIWCLNALRGIWPATLL